MLQGTLRYVMLCMSVVNILRFFIYVQNLAQKVG